jgi:hypothetical protein
LPARGSDRRRRDAEVVHETGHQGDAALDALVAAGVRAREPGPRQVETDDPVAVGQKPGQSIPAAQALVRGVQQDDRLTAALIDVVHAHSVDGRKLRLGQPVACDQFVERDVGQAPVEDQRDGAGCCVLA